MPLAASIDTYFSTSFSTD